MKCMVDGCTEPAEDHGPVELRFGSVSFWTRLKVCAVHLKNLAPSTSGLSLVKEPGSSEPPGTTSDGYL